MLFAIFPNHNGTTDMNIQGSNDTELRDFNTFVQKLYDVHRNTCKMNKNKIEMEQTSGVLGSSSNKITHVITLIENFSFIPEKYKTYNLLRKFVKYQYLFSRFQVPKHFYVEIRIVQSFYFL